MKEGRDRMRIDLGKRAMVLAIAIAVIIPLALGLMFYPPAHMELKELPFGILSLDEGANGVNMGDELAKKIESGDISTSQDQAGAEDTTPSSATDNVAASREDPADGDTTARITDILSFQVFASQEELDQALSNNELYGALIVSNDFTKTQMATLMTQQLSALQEGVPAVAAQQLASNAEALAAMAGSQEDTGPALTVILDYAKSPLVATQLESNVSGALSALGLEVDVQVIDEGPVADSENVSMLSGMLSQMMVLMPLMICSMLAGVFAVIGSGVRRAATAAERVRGFGLCVLVDAVAAFVIALMTYWLLACVAAIPAEIGPYLGFVWIASFFLAIFFSGCACFRGRAAVAMGVIIILLGMTSGYLPFEALPGFWQDWVCLWVPQYYLGNGLREVVFAGESIWNQGTIVCGIYAIIGVVLAPIGVTIWSRLAAKESQEA